jgi:hypothetical protein
VGPLIDVAPGAEGQPLARHLAELVRGNVSRDSAKRAEFERLRGAIAMVTDDGTTALTLRFDFGRLVVHGGVVGVPDVTVRGTTQALESLGDQPLRGLGRIALLAFRGGRRSPEGSGGGLRQGELQIYGFVTHPRLVRGLFAVLSRHG